MSIQKGIPGLFALGGGRKVDMLKVSTSPKQRQGKGPSDVEVPLYGEAAAIHVLYQAAFLDNSPPQPPRPRGRRGLWVARYLNSLSASLFGPAEMKA